MSEVIASALGPPAVLPLDGLEPRFVEVRLCRPEVQELLREFRRSAAISLPVYRPRPGCASPRFTLRRRALAGSRRPGKPRPVERRNPAVAPHPARRCPGTGPPRPRPRRLRPPPRHGGHAMKRLPTVDFDAFHADLDTVRNRVVRLGRHRQRASSSGSANFFRAVLADGSRVKGMVFPGELVWDDDPPPRANAELVPQGPVTEPCRARLRSGATRRPRDGRRAVPDGCASPASRASGRVCSRSWRPCGDRATRRPRNRREADGAPAIGIEARKGRDQALPGLGAKHESPGPQGHRPPKGNRRSRPWVTARAARGN